MALWLRRKTDWIKFEPGGSSTVVRESKLNYLMKAAPQGRAVLRIFCPLLLSDTCTQTSEHSSDIRVHRPQGISVLCTTG